MKLLRSTLCAVTLLACAAISFAQQQPSACPLKQAPEFNGFRIGMTMLDVKSRVADPSTFEEKLSSGNKIGSAAIELLGQDLKDEYADGVEDVHLTFVDKRLAIIKVTYNGAGNWMGAQDFFKQTAAKLGLTEIAATGATRGSGSNEKYRIDCTGFTALLAYSFGVSPNVTIYDAVAQRLVDERSEKNPDGKVKRIDMSPTIKLPSPQPTPPPR